MVFPQCRAPWWDLGVETSSADASKHCGRGNVSRLERQAQGEPRSRRKRVRECHVREVPWARGETKQGAPASSARSRCTRRQVATAHETSRIGRKHHRGDVASPRLLDVQVSRAPHCSRTDRHGISRCHEQQQCCSRQLQGLTVLTMLTVKVYHSDAASAADGVQC